MFNKQAKEWLIDLCHFGLQLKYGEVAETVGESSSGKRSNAHGNDSCLNNGGGTNSLEEVRLEIHFSVFSIDAYVRIDLNR